MKKLSLLFTCLTFVLFSNCQSEEKPPYVSEMFEFILSKSIHPNLDAKTSSNIFAIHKQELYVTDSKSFNNRKTDGIANIFRFNTITGKEDSYKISPPPDFHIEKLPYPTLIWSIAVSDSLLFVAVDREIWGYRFTKQAQYEYFKTINVESVFRLEIADNYLYAFLDEEDGFNWISINLTTYEIKNVRKLVLKNHFFLQISPIQVISIKNNALYFLQQNEPAIEKYSLTGEFIATYSLKIPNWNNIPEEIANKLDSIKDPTDRNYAFPKFSIFDYNFMFFFHVFSSERFFIMALDKKNSADGFATPYFVQVIGDTTIVDPFSVKLSENERFGEKYFPFLTPRYESNLIFAQTNEHIVQINRNTNVSWKNKTQKEFQRDENIYYRDNEPIEKIETYRFSKNYIPVDSINFLDYDDNLFSINDIKKDKAVFIITQQPQCSACIKAIWNFFSKKQMTNVDLYNVAPDCTTYLSKKDNKKDVCAYLKADYISLFFNSKALNPSVKRLLTQKGNPIILLFNKKLQHIEVISANGIIADFMGNLTPSFISTIDNFVGK